MRELCAFRTHVLPYDAVQLWMAACIGLQYSQDNSPRKAKSTWLHASGYSTPRTLQTHAAAKKASCTWLHVLGYCQPSPEGTAHACSCGEGKLHTQLTVGYTLSGRSPKPGRGSEPLTANHTWRRQVGGCRGARRRKACAVDLTAAAQPTISLKSLCNGVKAVVVQRSTRTHPIPVPRPKTHTHERAHACVITHMPKCAQARVHGQHTHTQTHMLLYLTKFLACSHHRLPSHTTLPSSPCAHPL